MLFVFSFPQAVLRIWGVIPVKAWVLGVILVGGNLIGTADFNVSGKNQVAYDVHLFGAAFAAIYFFSKWNLGKLGKWWDKLIAYIPFSKKGLKIYKPAEENSLSNRTQKEADRILEKIHKEGQESLTSKERRFLEEYSRSVRNRRNRTP